MKQLRRVALLLALTLLLSAIPAFAAESGLLIPKKHSTPNFSDTAGIWCEEEVTLCYETGILQGTSKTAFSPNATLTGAHVLAIAARLHSLLRGGTGEFPTPALTDDWWSSYETYLNGQGLYARDYLTGYGTPADRFGACRLLAKVLPETALPPINQMTSIPDLLNADVLSLYRAGILTGTDDYGTFEMNRPFTRGQMAAILARILDPAQRVSFTPKPFDVSREILGVDGSAVVMTVNGLPVTAEDFGSFLLSTLTFQGEEPIDPMEAAKREVITLFAVLSHEKDPSIALTAAELATVAEYATASAGYMGISRDHYLNALTRDALLVKLHAAMAIRYGKANADWQCNEQVNAWRDAAAVEVLPAFSTLKPAEITTRLLASPIGYIY